MRPTLIYPLLKISIHVFKGVWILSLVFPFCTIDQQQQRIRLWCHKLLSLFNINLVIRDTDHLGSGGYLLVANHISWIDIHVINAFRPHYFVAKSEVANWPIFGWMAKKLGTLFVERERAQSLRNTVLQMADLLQTQAICIFPEGTSSDGKQIRPFKSNVFEAAILAQAPIYSMAIQYFLVHSGEKTTAPAFTGEMGLLDSIATLLRAPAIYAELTFLPVLLPGHDRKTLAEASQGLIASRLRKYY